MLYRYCLFLLVSCFLSFSVHAEQSTTKPSLESLLQDIAKEDVSLALDVIHKRRNLYRQCMSTEDNNAKGLVCTLEILPKSRWAYQEALTTLSRYRLI